MAARAWPVGWAPAAAALLACAAIGVVAGIDPRAALFATLGLVFAVLTFVDLTAGLVILILVVFAETTPVAGPALSFTKLTGLLLVSAWVARLTTRPAGAERLLFTAHPILSYVLQQLAQHVRRRRRVRHQQLPRRPQLRVHVRIRRAPMVLK